MNITTTMFKRDNCLLMVPSGSGTSVHLDPVIINHDLNPINYNKKVAENLFFT